MKCRILFTATILVPSILVSSSAVATGAISTHTRSPWYAPLTHLSHVDRLRADCVMLRESRSTEAHPNLGDDNAMPGQSGIFQMSNVIGGVWDTYVLPRLHVLIWRASAFQQAEGFVIVVHFDGFGPWHRYDGC